jgi:predicted transcriptional regulator
VVTATTFLVQIIGPPSVRFAVIRAEEVGKNVSEEDLLASYRVNEIMDSKPPVLKRDTTLKQVLQIVEVEVLPVVSADKDRHLVGMIEQRRIRQVISREIFRRTHEEA